MSANKLGEFSFMDGNEINERPLNEREASILRAIVYEYISTGKPVGSRSFVQKLFPCHISSNPEEYHV